ncbi:acyl-CoA dehydrogenase [Streptomyces sp. S3(2020)]|uniref:acyl-CoA dehydrogenase n=1 Tax=Streptomyces sp. S3(2020) TaxID=2732044 RepID=UPI0014882F5D|nr:acyl-CoA dehydrogenase [Streptomyces sp. S3(2020)]NNN31862.1 acyl-CoA dehydrogenase [Streptomyces sp. S3(2020)]
MSSLSMITAPVRVAPARARVRRIEALLGDPAEDTNPAGYRTLLAADRAAVICDPAEAVLDSFGMNEEFVPTALGGRFDSPETLVQVLRAVFRRDAGLGMGYGMSTFVAANHVWMRGTAVQQRTLAGQLLSGSKAAMAQHETAHTNDFLRSQVRGTARPGGLSVTGAKPVINNLQRADALVMVLRTAEGHGGGCLSALLVDPRELPSGRFEITRRPSADAVGLRGYFRTGARFTDCPVPEDALLGPLGSGVPTSLLSFQMSRTLVASLAVAAVDTGLRTALLAGRGQGAGVGEASDPRSAAATLACAFTDLLLYDSLAVAATRALHLRPAETGLYSAAVKSLLPKVLRDTLHDLASVLGSQIYTREAPVGIFQKHLRDVPVISLGHAGTAACQATIIPQLPWLAGRSWFVDEEAPAAMFRPGAPLPPFSYDRLVLTDGRDSLSASLPAITAGLPARDPVQRALRTLAGLMVDELRDLRGRVLALEPPGPQSAVSPAWFALTDRYVLVLAAAAVLGVWRHSDALSEPFLADPAWAAAALHRIAGRLGIRDVELPAECLTRVHRELLTRFRDPHGFDLYDMPLAD